jgi:hypothetical protein
MFIFNMIINHLIYTDNCSLTGEIGKQGVRAQVGLCMAQVVNDEAEWENEFDFLDDLANQDDDDGDITTKFPSKVTCGHREADQRQCVGTTPDEKGQYETGSLPTLPFFFIF